MKPVLSIALLLILTATVAVAETEPARTHETGEVVVTASRYDDDTLMNVTNITNEELQFKGEDHEKVVNYLFGKNSKVFLCFHDAISLPHGKFCQFMATFFFVCRMNQNYNEMCADKHNARRQTLAWLDS